VSMKKKKLFNTSEYKTVIELRKVLEGTGFYIHPEMQLKKVIELEDRETLSIKDKKTFNTAFFDFVVYNKESLPEFVIEFDGPHHLTNRKKREADIRKNRLCSLATLPLFRIDDSLLTKYEEISLLGYIVARFVAWRNESISISREIEERLSYARSPSDVDYYDPWNDPTFIFDIKHPFPASTEVAERLFNNYGIVTDQIDDETYHCATSQYPYLEFHRDQMGAGPISNYARRVEHSYRLAKNFQDSSGKYDSEKLHKLSIRVDYKWGHPTYDHTDRNPVDKIPSILFQGIPGTSMSELSDHLCDFLALREIEKWAQNSLLKKS